MSPNSTRRRVASERLGMSGWFSAHFTIEARNTGDARNPIIGSRPVAGRPRRFFGLAFIGICKYWFSLNPSRREAANFGPEQIDAYAGCVGEKVAARAHTDLDAVLERYQAIFGNAENEAGEVGDVALEAFR